jgi:4-alpha-glucanotransferase
VTFHAWLQWCFDRQLARASGELARIADMPVGVDPGGFDAWDWQDHVALGASLGAPPDRFNAAGQSWGLPPFVPHRLRAARYAPFVETLRAQLRHAGGLRIDHVLGLFRQWWVPAGESPKRGAYVRVPTDELFEIVAIESERARAVVVGEDLGTVPPGVRRELRRRRLLSTRLALFERVPPSRYPRGSFAGITTHDLPTVAGAIGEADARDQRAAGLEPDPEGADLLRRRLRSAAGVGPRAPADRVALELHRRLAAGPPALVAATLEDALGVEERPNLPGTVAPQRANWSIALPRPLEAIREDAGMLRSTEGLQRSRRQLRPGLGN